MALNPWKAPQEILDLIKTIQHKNHLPRLTNASITACCEDSKAFVKNKINLGKVTKFSPFSKLWQADPHDFCLIIPISLWSDVLQTEQRLAYLDLQITRCEVEYEPEIIEENGKKKKVKDEFGRIQYSDQIKTDDEGNPKWKVLPLMGSIGLEVFTKNVRRYGPWLESIEELKEATNKWDEKAKTVDA